MTQLRRCLLVVLALSGAVAASAEARPGDLDPAFSTDGFAQVEFGGQPNVSDPLSAAMNPIGLAEDGDVLLGGTRIDRPPCEQLGCFGEAYARLARLNPDGTPDSTLGGTGVIESKFGQNAAGSGFASGLSPDAFTVDAQGRILIVARSGADVIVVRITPAGELDQGFGSGGVRTIDLPTGFAIADITGDGENRILLGGAIDSGPTAGDKDGLAIRLLPDGANDPAFGGGDGIVTLDLAPYDFIDRIAVSPDGTILTAGQHWNSQAFTVNLAFARLRDDGTLDPTFGAGAGSIAIDPRPDIGSNTHVSALAVDGLGRPTASIGVFLETSAAGPNDPGLHRYLVRLTQKGDRDSELGPNGLKKLDIPGDAITLSVTAGAMALQPDGRIVIGGSGGGPVVTRLTADGDPDPTFGVGGRAQVYGPVAPSFGSGVIIDSIGRIVLGGGTLERHPRPQVAVFRTDTNPPDDADADGVLTATDDCPGLYGPPSGCPNHKRKLTIRRTDKGVAGTIASGGVGCVSDGKVRIYAKRKGRDRRVGAAGRRSGPGPVDAGEQAVGRWSLETARPGRLYARITRTTTDATGTCSAARTRAIAIR